MNALARIGTLLALGTMAPAFADNASDPAEDTGLQEIVVTAQRREENLQRAAVAISVVTGNDIEAAGVKDLAQLTTLIPALTVSPESGGSVNVYIRGVGSFAGNTFGEPGVAINYDGVYLSVPQGPEGLFYDIDRTEVLKGPQGTLYGRNATAGALNIVTNKPSDQFETSASVEAGNYDLKDGTLMVNVPLSPTAAIRFAGQVISREGYLSDGYDDDHAQSGRLSLKLAPTADLSVLVTGDYTRQTGMGNAAVWLPFVDPSHPYTGPTDPRLQSVLPPFVPPFTRAGFINNDSYGVSATIDYVFDSMVATFIPAYRHNDLDYLHYGAGFPVQSTDTANQTSLELRLASKDEGALKWLVGAYYFDLRLPSELTANQGVTYNTIDIPDLTTKSEAIFGQSTLSLTNALRATAGLRYTHEHKTVDGTSLSPLAAVPAFLYPIVCPAPASFNAAAGTCTAPVDGAETFTKITWKAGLEYDVAAQSMAYFNASTGFKSGGFYPSAPPNTYGPETLLAYTLGSKNRFLNDTVQLNAEAFDWNYKDQQITHLGPVSPSGYNLITQNAGRSTLYGLDMDVTWLATEKDLIGAELQLEHTKYGQFQYNLTVIGGGAPATGCPSDLLGPDPAGQDVYRVDCSGRRLPFAPEVVANMKYRHTFDLPGGSSLIAGAATRFETRYELGVEYLPGEAQSSFAKSDVDLTYRSTRRDWTVQAYVRNLEDRAVAENSFVQPVVGRVLGPLADPRTFGVRFTYDFKANQ